MICAAPPYHPFGGWAEKDDLHTCLVAAFAEHDLLVVAEAHLPHWLARLADVANTRAHAEVPPLTRPSQRHMTTWRSLNRPARHRVVVCTQPLHTLVRVLIKCNHAAVEAAGDERVVEQLQLSHQRRVVTEERKVAALARRPHEHRRVACRQTRPRR